MFFGLQVHPKPLSLNPNPEFRNPNFRKPKPEALKSQLSKAKEPHTPETRTIVFRV